MTWRTWPIDEEYVESSKDTWEDVYRRQRLVPSSVLAFFVGVIAFTGNWMYAVVGFPLVLYAAWPVLAAYEYMNRDEEATP